MMSAMQPEYMTTEEVAELLRTSVETVRYWSNVGKGPKSFKVGRRRLYAAEDVQAFIEAAKARSLMVGERGREVLLGDSTYGTLDTP